MTLDPVIVGAQWLSGRVLQVLSRDLVVADWSLPCIDELCS